MTVTRQVIRYQIADLKVRLAAKTAILKMLEAGEKRRRRALADYQSAKTHCPAGHKYQGKNLILVRGERRCRQCKRISDRERLAKKRGKK